MFNDKSENWSILFNHQIVLKTSMCSHLVLYLTQGLNRKATRFKQAIFTTK